MSTEKRMPVDLTADGSQALSDVEAFAAEVEEWRTRMRMAAQQQTKTTLAGAIPQSNSRPLFTNTKLV